jgi:hypothetical protein
MFEVDNAGIVAPLYGIMTISGTSFTCAASTNSNTAYNAHQYRIYYGDGTAQTNAWVSGNPAPYTYTFNHSFPSNGTYTVTSAPVYSNGSITNAVGFPVSVSVVYTNAPPVVAKRNGFYSAIVGR